MSHFRIRIGNISLSANQWHFPLCKGGTKTPNLSFPLHDVDPPFNTAMPRRNARTTPNRSADGWGAVAHVGLRRKIPVGYNGAPQIRPPLKSTPSRGPISKLHYLPHPWTRPTYDAKWHSGPTRRFSTMHWFRFTEADIIATLINWRVTFLLDLMGYQHCYFRN